MQMAPHITAIQTDLAAAAALGDEATAEAARRVSEALGTSLHLRLLDLLGEAALDVNGQLPSGHVVAIYPALVGHVELPDSPGTPRPPARQPSEPVVTTFQTPGKVRMRISIGSGDVQMASHVEPRVDVELIPLRNDEITRTAIDE